MNLYSTVLLGLAMSTDAFAAALGKGAGMDKPRWRDALRIGLVFGLVEGSTALVGWLIGGAASHFIEQWADWAAFALLLALGLHMIRASFEKDAPHDDEDSATAAKTSNVITWILASMATSIDALAIGIGLAFMHAGLGATPAIIGACVFAMVTIGIMAGHKLGTLIGKRAEFLGGFVLICVGAAILWQHLHKG